MYSFVVIVLNQSTKSPNVGQPCVVARLRSYALLWTVVHLFQGVTYVREPHRVAPTIKIIPWKWFGIITNSSNSRFLNFLADSCHHFWTITPASFTRISLSTTSPNKHSLSCVQMVTKYAPAVNNHIPSGGSNGGGVCRGVFHVCILFVGAWLIRPCILCIRNDCIHVVSLSCFWTMRLLL